MEDLVEEEEHHLLAIDEGLVAFVCPALSTGGRSHALLCEGFGHITGEVRAPDQQGECPTLPFGDENIDCGGVDEGVQCLIAPSAERGERLFPLAQGCRLQQKVAYAMRKEQTHHQESIYRIHGGRFMGCFVGFVWR